MMLQHGCLLEVSLVEGRCGRAHGRGRARCDRIELGG